MSDFRDVYRREVEKALVQGLTRKAAHELGLFATYLAGKASARGASCRRCGGTGSVAGMPCSHIGEDRNSALSCSLAQLIVDCHGGFHDGTMGSMEYSDLLELAYSEAQSVLAAAAVPHPTAPDHD